MKYAKVKGIKPGEFSPGKKFPKTGTAQYLERLKHYIKLSRLQKPESSESASSSNKG